MSKSLFDPADVADWRAVEDVLNQASDGASEPFYSQVEAAKECLFRLGCAAEELARLRAAAGGSVSDGECS